MKKIELLKKALMLITCLALSSVVLHAQSAAKKPGIKNDPVQLKIAKQEALAKKQAEQKAKCEANGSTYQSNTAAKQKNAARPCVKPTQGLISVNRTTFNHLSPRGQEIIKSHPEKYKIVD